MSIRIDGDDVAFWQSWCADFNAKVFPIFEAAGFSHDTAALIFVTKHLRGDVDDVREAVCDVVEAIGNISIEIETDSDDDEGESWKVRRG